MTQVPVSERPAPPSANYEEKVALRNQISKMGSQKRETNLFLRATDVSRKACGDVVRSVGGVAHILRIARERFAPDAIGSIFQDVVEFMYIKRAHLTGHVFGGV